MPPLVMFDLDQTLAESKQPLEPQMALLVSKLLEKTKVAVISGGAVAQFLVQVVDKLPQGSNLSNLYLLPTSGAQLYEYKDGSWHNVYAERLTDEEAAKIKQVVEEVAHETGIVNLSAESYGERIENRGAQISFSALGQQAPIDLKKAWDPDKSKRRTLQQAIEAQLPEYSVKMGGSTTIDITKTGIDKAYGITKIAEHLGLPIAEMVYVGDELEDGGNDEAAKRTDIKTHGVTNPSDTETYIDALLNAQLSTGGA